MYIIFFILSDFLHQMHDYAATFIHTCVAAVEEDGGKSAVVVDEIGTV